MSFAAYTLGICILAVALLGATGVTVLNRRLRRHGVLVTLYRWHTGMPHHGKEVTDAGWFRAGTRVLTRTGHASRFQHRPRWQRTAPRTSPEFAVLFVLYGLLADVVVTASCLAAASAAAAAYGVLRAMRRWTGRKHRRSWLEPAHVAPAARFGHPLAKAPSWIELEKDRSAARLALPKGKVFDATEQLQHAAAAITKLGITGADPREDVQWKQTGLGPHVNITRPAPCRARRW